MGRCKHVHAYLTEYGTISRSHYLVSGTPLQIEEWGAHYRGAINVICLDCGYNRHFRAKQKRPAWIERLYASTQAKLEEINGS